MEDEPNSKLLDEDDEDYEARMRYALEVAGLDEPPDDEGEQDTLDSSAHNHSHIAGWEYAGYSPNHRLIHLWVCKGHSETLIPCPAARTQFCNRHSVRDNCTCIVSDSES